MATEGEAKPISLPWRRSSRYHCFGCAPREINPAGLAMKMVAEGSKLICDFCLTNLHESFPGMIHGGVSAAILDELMGNALVHLERKICVTTSMKITYGGSILVGRHYRAQAWLEKQPRENDDLFRVSGEIVDAEGNALVIARGTFLWVSEPDWSRAFGVEVDDTLRPFLRPPA